MGRVAWTQNVAFDAISSELSSYARAMSPHDRKIFENLLLRSYKHVGASSYAGSIHAWAFFLLSIILEQEKLLRRLPEYESLASRRVPIERQTSFLDQK